MNSRDTSNALLNDSLAEGPGRLKENGAVGDISDED